MLQWGYFCCHRNDLIPTNGELSAMWFILFGTIVATDPTVHCLFVVGHSLFANEKACVSAFDVVYSLKQATKFGCKAVLPNCLVGVGFDEVAILKDIASDIVDDGSNEVD